MSWPVPPEWEGERADRVLANLSGRSRADVRAAIEAGAVLLDGDRVEPRTKVGSDAEFTGEIPDHGEHAAGVGCRAGSRISRIQTRRGRPAKANIDYARYGIALQRQAQAGLASLHLPLCPWKPRGPLLHGPSQ